MDEYIKRDDAKNAVHGHWLDSSRTLGAIMDIPAADVAPVVHGRWIEYKYETVSVARGRKIHNTKNHCSVCHESNGRKKTNFCPNCGAKMDLEDTEHENQT